MTTFDHVHYTLRMRWPKLVAVLAVLRLPYSWLIRNDETPHDPECTAETAVLVQEGDGPAMPLIEETK